MTVTGAQEVKVADFPGNPSAQHRPRDFLATVQKLEKKDHLGPAQAIQREKFSVLGRELRRARLQVIRTEADVTTMTIRFTDIGRPHIIKAPTHAIRIYGLS